MGARKPYYSCFPAIAMKNHFVYWEIITLVFPLHSFILVTPVPSTFPHLRVIMSQERFLYYLFNTMFHAPLRTWTKTIKNAKIKSSYTSVLKHTNISLDTHAYAYTRTGFRKPLTWFSLGSLLLDFHITNSIINNSNLHRNIFSSYFAPFPCHLKMFCTESVKYIWKFHQMVIE